MDEDDGVVEVKPNAFTDHDLAKSTSPTRTRADSESASRQEFVIDLTKAVPNDSLPQINSPAEQEIIERVNRSFSRSSSVTVSSFTAVIEKEMALYDTEDIVTKVHKPEKVVKPMESFVIYTVSTKTTREEFSEPEYTVKRRYNDFLWLHDQLSQQHHLLILPPLPEKQHLTLDRFDKQFISYREAALCRFVSRLCQHPLFSYSKFLQAFLTLEPNAFSRYKKQSSSSTPLSIVSYLQYPYSSYKNSITPSYEHQALYKYADKFGEKMAALERITHNLVQRQSDYAKSMAAYSSAYNQWASSETELSSPLQAMAELYDHILITTHELIDRTPITVSLSFKEYYLFSAVIKSSLDKRDYEQYRFEKSLAMVKGHEESSNTPQSPALSASMSDSNRTCVAASLTNDKSADVKPKHEPGEADARDKLDKANAEIEADFQRWNINKNRDLRNCIEEMASRNINFYDSQLSCLESLLKKLKERKFQSSPLLNQRRDV